MKPVGKIYSLVELNKKIMKQVRELADSLPARYVPMPYRYEQFYPAFTLSDNDTGLLVIDKQKSTGSIEFLFDDRTVLYAHEVLSWAEDCFQDIPKLKHRESYQELYLKLLIRYLKKVMKKETDTYNIYFK